MARVPAGETTELETLGALAQHPSVDGALNAVRDLLNMDIAYATRFDDGEQIFETITGDAASFGVHQGLRMPLEATYCHQMLCGDMAPTVPDMTLDPVGATMPVTSAAGVRAYASVPVRLTDGTLYGTLCCASHDALPLDDRDQQFLHVLARLISGELERAELEEQARSLQVRAASSLALVAAMEARDRYTSDHSRAVVELAGAVARRLGLGPAAIGEAEQVALLHDIGKLAIPDSILHHPGPLDEDQWTVMKTHTLASEQIVTSIPGLRHLATCVRAEHERWDGTGYPDGLSGETIPLSSRIALACDAYHAMTSDRPYRLRLSEAEARSELARCAGTQFDPQVIDALLDVLSE